MISQKTLFLLFVFIFGMKDVNTLNACAAGDKAFELLQYSKAIYEYEKCLKKSPDDIFILERLGDSYLILDNSLKAEEIYLKIAKKTKKYSPALLKYTNTLYLNNKLDLYQSIVDSLSKKYPKQKEIQKLKNYKVHSENIKYNVKPVKFNAAEADFSPVYHGNKIIFSSSRPQNKKNDLFTGQSFSQLYSVDTSNLAVNPFLPEISMKYNVGTCTFYDEGKKIMFSANDKTKLIRSTYLLQLYTSELVNGEWSKPKLFIHNQRNSNNVHPTINPSANILVFASDSYGNSGMDLFFCSKDALGNWKMPIKLKNNINTTNNEVFPVFVNDSMMIFSSDGLQSVGKGLDMYKTTFKKGKWSDPILLDAPFNSVADDYGLCTNDDMQTGYFTSNRQSPEGNEDIYLFSMAELDSLIQVPEVITSEVILTQLTGKLISEKGEILSGANIVFYNADGDIITQTTSNMEGTFKIEVLESQRIDYKVEKVGYFPETGTFLPNEVLLNGTIGLELKLRPLIKDAIFRLENIYYDYDKWDILPESEVELNNLFDVLMQHPDMKIELSSHTDARGKDAYNLSLSDKRAKSAVAYLIQLGIEPSRITAKGYGETKLTNHCKNGITCTDDEHRKNRRTEVKIVAVK
jgi:outer membrane protein OmpA-like peptidoglycan-associated protein/tetratricopeptide (TPR) repeat protein